MNPFDKAWDVLKGPRGNRRPPIRGSYFGTNKTRCQACKTPTWPGQDEADALDIKEEEQAWLSPDGSMVDVGGGSLMWLCDDCALEHKERGDN